MKVGAVGVALALTQVGCPGGAELENPGQWSEILGSGGTAGTGGSGAVGGSGGMAPIVLDPATVDCGALDPVTVIGMDCAKNTGCHKGNLAAGGLSLVFDNGLAMRLKDVPAKHRDINCSTDPPPAFEPCPAPATDKCGTGKLLVSSKDPASSWMLAKLHEMQAACGDAMPPPPVMDYPTNMPDHAACIEAIVNAVAALK